MTKRRGVVWCCENMGKAVYILMESSGIYDAYEERPIMASFDENKLEALALEFNTKEALNKYRSLRSNQFVLEVPFVD